MARLGPENALDHVVVVMFENRSFDNLLGRLYEPGEVDAFEGVLGKELSNPIPAWLPDGARGPVSYGVAGDMNTPAPDPGEEFHHVNTQLFGILDEANRGQAEARGSFNTPPTGRRATMDGFVADYASMLLFENGRMPSYDEYAKIMTGYTPEQMPVMSAIARGFATFDHWFCEVPSCTFPNRSFFHAGTSSGHVINFPPPDAFPAHNPAETLFDRLDAAGLSWRVYCAPPCHASLTGIIHAARLRPKFATHFVSTAQFFDDAEKGNLPTYSFIEPQIIGYAHNDMHPPFGHLLETMATSRGITEPDRILADPPSSLIAGEELLARIYRAIRSSTANGSNHLNTTLLVTFDEHGGTYDHVPPPPAVPPTGEPAPGQMGFAFDRSGVRIPTLAISAWIPERTVVREEYRATSLIATMRERWKLGSPLTARDASARSFAGIFTSPVPRAQDDWPEVTARPVPAGPESFVPMDAPLGLLGKSLLGGVVALGKGMGVDVPDLKPDQPLTGREGIEAAQHVLAELFPRLQER
ncbi:alkaline phosphatase family protein [Streptomyces sp. SM13]|uniref:alkaline phosphatase family protein n=1 Tax=Streptomyces sp. SM13 TaxID=1983803 RepID=UPI0015E17371|nr:alkaline phosphatase family protein [Streptomyces sp. SM13]